MVKTSSSKVEGVGLILSQGTKIPHATGCGQKLNKQTQH